MKTETETRIVRRRPVKDLITCAGCGERLTADKAFEVRFGGGHRLRYHDLGCFYRGEAEKLICSASDAFHLMPHTAGAHRRHLLRDTNAMLEVAQSAIEAWRTWCLSTPPSVAP